MSEIVHEYEWYDDGDDDDFPTASSMSWYKCDRCMGLHLELKDEDGYAFAGATLSEEALLSMLRTLREGQA